MQLSAIKLIKITLDSKRILEQFGEPIDFYMNSEVDIETYFALYQHQSNGITNELMALLATIIRTSSGQLLLGPDDRLPISIIPDVIRAVLQQMDQVRNQQLNPNGDWTTARLVSIGSMAKEWGILPHVIRDTATTYDLMVFDVINTWEKYQIDKATGKSSYEPSLEQMKEMMAQAKGAKNE